MLRISALACCLTLCLPISVQGQTTAFYYYSEPGDYVGQGQERSWTASDLQFSAEDSSPSRVRIRADNFATAPSSQWISWRVSFRAPTGTLLAPGVYEQARREPFAGDALPGLEATGGSGCNRLTGRFEVFEIEFDSAGQLIRFAADFEQHCEDNVPALYGAIRYNAARSSLLPFDGAFPVYAITIAPSAYGYVSGSGIDCGAGRTDCAETFAADTSIALSVTPLPGYVFLGWSTPDCTGTQIGTARVFRRRFCEALFDVAPEGDAALAPDYSAFSFYLDDHRLSGTRTKRVYIPPAASISPFLTSPELVRFFVEDDLTGWRESISFKAPLGETLAPGIYNYAAGNSDWDGGLGSVSFPGCTSGGRFVIHEVSFIGDTLTSFAADFEMYCSSPPGRVTGSIRFFSSRQSLLPFGGAYPVYSLEVFPGAGGRVVSVGTIDCGDGSTGDCHEDYGGAQAIILEAQPSAGYSFIGWTEGCGGEGTSVAVMVDRVLRCGAVFSPAPGSSSPGDPSNALSTLFVHAPGATSAPTRSIWMWPETDVEVSRSEDSVTFSFRSAASTYGSLSLRSATGPVLPGDYEEATGRFSSLRHGLSVNDCFVVEGRFRVYEVVVGPSGGLLRFAADFEARCSSSSRPYVVGAVRFNSTRRSLVPFEGAYPIHKVKIIPAFNGTVTGPGIDCGAGRADCDETFGSAQVINVMAAPAAGYRFVAWGGACQGSQRTTVAIERGVRRCYAVFNAVVPGVQSEDPALAKASLFLDGEPGGPVADTGSGTRQIWTDVLIDSSGFSRNMAHLWVSIADGTSLSLEFRASGTTELRPGTYDGASSSSSTTGPRISFSGSAALFRFCSPGPLVGRFVVHEVVFQSATSANLVSFAADFEFRCANTTPAMRGSIRMNSSRATVVPFASTTHPGHLPPDFSGDGSPDLVWRNSVTGRNAFWFMNGDAMGATPPFSAGADLVADLDWEIRAVGDMDGDRRGDVIWQHATNGKLAAWLFVGATRVATPLFITLSGSPTEPDLDWKIVGAADMNADGHTDVLWRHRVSGALRVWHMRGMEQLESVDLALVVADQQWQVAGIADMNGDGWPDIVWRHYGNGRMAAWFMIDTFVVSTTVLPTLVSDTQWRLAGVADIDRDGHADFVWQHLTGGRLAVWYMNGLNPVTYGSITPAVIADPNWRIAGVR